MHSRCPDSALSLCRDDNSSVSFTAEVPTLGDESTLLYHCLQGRHPAPNNNCAKPSNSLPAILVIAFPESVAFAPANSDWKAAHILQQQHYLRYSGATNPLYQRSAHRGTAVLSGGDFLPCNLPAYEHLPSAPRKALPHTASRNPQMSAFAWSPPLHILLIAIIVVDHIRSTSSSRRSRRLRRSSKIIFPIKQPFKQPFVFSIIVFSKIIL